LHKVEVVSGVVLILIGLLIATGYSSLIASSRFAGWLPNLEPLLKVAPAAPATPAPGNSTFAPAPDVEFEALDGKSVRLSSLRGRVVLLNFWATWCGPCRAEIPEFNALQKDLNAKGLSVVGVSVSPVDTPDAIRNFQKDIKQDYMIWRGAEAIGGQFGNGPGLPVTYVIDRAGLIRQRFYGPQTRESFAAAIKPLLDESPATAQRVN
jgi:thiol-disulfide isomerase/thioredoxin